MSENIQSHFNTFAKKNKIAYTNLADNDNISDGADSKEAHKSEQTKISTAVVAVSPPVALQETSRSIQTFGLVYDRLFR